VGLVILFAGIWWLVSAKNHWSARQAPGAR
jgi:hypothetical protein